MLNFQIWIELKPLIKEKREPAVIIELSVIPLLIPSGRLTELGALLVGCIHDEIILEVDEKRLMGGVLE